LLQVQRLFTDAFQGIKPAVERLRGAWESGGKRVASWALWLRQQQLESLSSSVLPAWSERPVETRHTLAPVKPIPMQQDAPSASLTLLQVADEHLKNQEREGLPIKTLDDKRAVATLCARIIGDLPVDQVTRKHAHQFKETALKLPPRMHQLPAQPLEKTIAEAKTTISLTTFNNYVKNLTSFCNYAVREGYCPRNPFLVLRVRQRRKVSEERSAFSTEDLQKLFSKVTYAPKNSPQPHKYWLPLLGLYTGARLNELCQLYLDDVVTVNGIQCIHFRETRPDQKLKTVSSERLVPMHSRLRELGFPEFIKAQQELGHQRVFPEPTCHKKHGYSADTSKWFTRVRELHGFRDDGAKKDFHSCCHTLADHLKKTKQIFLSNLVARNKNQ
jgi:integrase